MAARFWVGGTGNWNDTAHWSTTSGGGSGSAAPTSSDDVTFDSNSGTTATVTVNVAANANTITINKSDLTLLDSSGMTVVGAVTLTTGTLNTNGQTEAWGSLSSNNSNTRTLTLGASGITISGASANVWDISTATGLTLSAASSTITFSGAGVTIAPGAAKTYGTVNLTGSGTAQLNGSGVIYGTLNRTGTAVKTDAISFTAATTVTGTLTLAGNSITNRLLVQSNSIGTARTITNTGASLAASQHVDIQDITLSTAWDASGITGGSGDAGGNSGITFTTAATQTWSGTSGANWSANAWTSRVPLPQDNVVISAAFSAAQSVVVDMPRLGKSIDWTGATGTPTWNFSTTNSVYGSITLIAGMTLTGGSSTTLRGRSSFTLTSAGKQFTQPFAITAPSGTYTLQDAFSVNSTLTLNNGTLNANNFNVTFSTFTCTSAGTRALTMGTGTWSDLSTSTANVWNIATSGLTFSGASATIAITGVTANVKTFIGAGLTYGTLTYTIAGSTGTLVVTGANTFTAINFSDASNARTLTLPAATTTTVTTFNVNGTAGKLMTVNSSTGASAATLSKSSGTVSCDYLSIQDSTATGGATWYAGANSTNVSGNTGWIFTAPPKGGTMLLMGV